MTRDWLTLGAGPAAWFAAHVATWMLSPGAHEPGSVRGMLAIDAIALVVTLLAGVLAALRLRALDTGETRDRFLAMAGLGVSALSSILVVGLALPLVLLVPGAEP